MFVFVFVVLMLNATANALAIGLSGYAHAGLRAVIAVVMVGSLFISNTIVVGSTSYALGVMFRSQWVAVFGVFAGTAATCILFCSLGLQLGRMHIRPFLPPSKDLPVESATTGGVFALIMVAPIILLISTVVTAGFGGFLGVVLFAWCIIVMDRRVDKLVKYTPAAPTT